MSNFVINSDFGKFKSVFLEENSRLNLISKNDEKLLYEKHFYDSLALKLFIDTYKIKDANILDIGTGGGFPAIPLAMEYPEFNVCGIDSISKKINAVNRMADKLGLKNLTTLNERVENIKDKTFDIVVSRAVAKIDKLTEYAYPVLKKGGYIVLYKSLSVNDELDIAKTIIRKYQLKIKPLIEYHLPLDENFTRYLVVLEK